MEEDTLVLLQKRLFKNKHLDLLEEATKQSFIIPFISYLGFDVLNPNEVLPEFKAGDTPSDAVDYALCYKSNPILFLEAKRQRSKLVNDFDQLKKYVLSNDKVNVGSISNGLIYVFFIKSELSNEMINKPFYQLNVSRLSEKDKLFLSFLKRTKFSIEYLKDFYTDEEIKSILNEAEKIINKEYLIMIFGSYIN